MPSSGPLQQTVEDGVVNALKDSFADHVPVIVGPAPYFGIQPIDQLGGRQAQGGFDYLPDAVQEDFHILLGGLDEIGRASCRDRVEVVVVGGSGEIMIGA